MLSKPNKSVSDETIRLRCRVTHCAGTGTSQILVPYIAKVGSKVSLRKSVWCQHFKSMINLTKIFQLNKWCNLKIYRKWLFVWACNICLLNSFYYLITLSRSCRTGRVRRDKKKNQALSFMGSYE